MYLSERNMNSNSGFLHLQSLHFQPPICQMGGGLPNNLPFHHKKRFDALIGAGLQEGILLLFTVASLNPGHVLRRKDKAN